MQTIGIAGGSGSGKTTLADALACRFGEGRATILPHDAYYRDLSHLPEADRAGTNFDHPDSLETDLLVSHLNRLRSGSSIALPQYDFVTHTRLASDLELSARDVVVVEGILALAVQELRDVLDVKVYVDTSDDIRLARRIERDLAERGRSADSVLAQYRNTTRPMHDRFVAPTIAFADFIVSGEKDPGVAVEVLAGAIEGKVQRDVRRET